VDTSDIYHKIKRRFDDSKLCYDAYFEKVSSWGTIQQAFAYGMQTDNEAGGFITCLKMTGFDVRFKRPRIIKISDREIKRCNWGVKMTLDVVRTIDRLNMVVLGVSNPDFIPLVYWIRDQGIKVTILASCIPKSLRDAADTAIEINEDFLEGDEEEEEEEEE
jgi:uncharacterized LabA/DUF88 family protein